MPSLLHSLFDFFVPRTCLVCGRRLSEGETGYLCTACLMDFPFVRPPYVAGSRTERRFWGILPMGRAATFFCYQSHTASTRIILALKYARQPHIGDHFGFLMGQQLTKTDFFDGVDCIVPVPLTRWRQFRRGYNQSEHIAKGLARASGLPVRTDLVRRKKNRRSQTRVGPHMRASNVEGIFCITHPERVAGLHILLVDDVLTTGATLTSCGRTLAAAGVAKISIATLGCTDHYPNLIPNP